MASLNIYILLNFIARFFFLVRFVRGSQFTGPGSEMDRKVSEKVQGARREADRDGHGGSNRLCHPISPAHSTARRAHRERRDESGEHDKCGQVCSDDSVRRRLADLSRPMRYLVAMRSILANIGWR